MLVAGCYRSHELGPADRPIPRDAGTDLGRDARPPRDLAPPDPPDLPLRDGVYWTLEETEPWLSIPHELGCIVHEGGRITVEVGYAIDTQCDHAGPVTVDRAGGGTYVVRAFYWRRHDPDPEACSGITWAEERHLVVEAPDEGTYRFETATGGAVASVAVMRDSADCAGGGEGAPCVVDCQCAGDLVCVPGVGDFVECHGGRCQRPCDLPNAPEGTVYAPHLDCPPTHACSSASGLAAPTCAPLAGDGCAEVPSHCGPGTGCPPIGVISECSWQIELNARVRHPCGSDADCGEGLHCVEHETGERSCEIPCFTHRMACPPMHACSPTRWVCEWLGE